MAASKKAKPPKGHADPILRHAPPDVQIPKKLGGGVLKELAVQNTVTGRLEHYAFAYINPLIFAGDNGRVLGYDNKHGFPHRHYMGQITPEPDSTWEEIRERFEAEWRQIAVDFVNGGQP